MTVLARQQGPGWRNDSWRTWVAHDRTKVAANAVARCSERTVLAILSEIIGRVGKVGAERKHARRALSAFAVPTRLREKRVKGGGARRHNASRSCARIAARVRQGDDCFELQIGIARRHALPWYVRFGWNGDGESSTHAIKTAGMRTDSFPGKSTLTVDRDNGDVIALSPISRGFDDFAGLSGADSAHSVEAEELAA